MLINLEMWYLFPMGVGISVIAMSSGISGANFWIPVYLTMLHIDTKLGFWLALLTMVFGFGSGVYRNLKNNNIDFWLAKRYLIICAPASFVGSILSTKADQFILLSIFGTFIICYGLYMALSGLIGHEKVLIKTNKIGWFIPLFGGFIKGLVATGLGKLIMPQMYKHERIETFASAVGTTVFVVFVVNLVALTGRIDHELINVISTDWKVLVSILFWVVPSVVVGGQLGPIIAQVLPKKYVLIYVGVLLIIVGLLMHTRASEEEGITFFQYLNQFFRS